MKKMWDKNVKGKSSVKADSRHPASKELRRMVKAWEEGSKPRPWNMAERPIGKVAFGLNLNDPKRLKRSFRRLSTLETQLQAQGIVDSLMGGQLAPRDIGSGCRSVLSGIGG